MENLFEYFTQDWIIKHKRIFERFEDWVLDERSKLNGAGSLQVAIMSYNNIELPIRRAKFYKIDFYELNLTDQLYVLKQFLLRINKGTSYLNSLTPKNKRLKETLDELFSKIS